MTRPTAKDIIEIIGITAIVGSLVFLAIEVRHNTRAVDAAEMNNIWNAWREAVFLPVMENPEFAELLTRESRGEPISDAEFLQVFMYRTAQFDIWAQLFDLHKDGVISDEKWAYWDAGIWNMLQVDEMYAAWSQVSGVYDPEFQDHIARGFEERMELQE